MITPWSSRCESGNCVETRTRTVEGHEYVEVRDTETDGTLRVTAKAWAEHEAALRAEGRQQALAVLRDDTLYREWSRQWGKDPAGPRSYVPAVQRDVMHDYAEWALTAVRDDTKGTADDD